jgi:hypothetical protein
VDALEDEDALLNFDFAVGLAYQTSIRRIHLAGLQRASEGARQSAGGGRDDVVERSRMLGLAASSDLVMVRDRVVNAERNRLFLGREIGTTQRPVHSFDPDLRVVDDFSHTSRTLPHQPQPVLTPK